MEIEAKQNFINIIKNDAELIRLLKIVNELNLQDAFIAAGAIRNLIWDSLHKYPNRTPLNDIDVVYFNAKNITPEADLIIWKKLCKVEPHINWNVFNQARAHIKNKSRKKVYSTEEGMAYWSETPTCIGVRLDKDEEIIICAPYGIDDLMNLRVRPIPKPLQDLKLYNERVLTKNWKKIWPKLQIMSTE